VFFRLKGSAMGKNAVNLVGMMAKKEIKTAIKEMKITKKETKIVKREAMTPVK
jgi:hypothetical protein